MLSTLILATALCGQSIDNSGKIWTGSGYAFAVYDTTKPVRFSGGGLSVDLFWNPAMDGFGGGFQSLPFVIAGLQWPITLEFYPRMGYDDATWGLLERDGHSVGDYMVEFGSASTGPKVDVSGNTDRLGMRLWALARAGAMPFTLSQ